MPKIQDLWVPLSIHLSLDFQLSVCLAECGSVGWQHEKLEDIDKDNVCHRGSEGKGIASEQTDEDVKVPENEAKIRPF